MFKDLKGNGQGKTLPILNRFIGKKIFTTINTQKSYIDNELMSKTSAIPHLMATALEPRVMLDAAGVVSVIDAPDISESNSDQVETTSSNAVVPTTNPIDNNDDNDTELNHTDLSGRNVVFLSAGVQDIDVLRDGFSQDAEVFIIETSSNGFMQMSDILSGQSDISSISIVGHGDTGQVLMGNSVLSSATLGDNMDALIAIRDALSESGDLLFYGCDVASDSAGVALMSDIAQITGADVAASSDTTGGADGDWDLEFKSGEIETDMASVQSFASSYDHSLALPGARSHLTTGDSATTELFLGGNFIELGISKWGDFGSQTAKPAGFYGTGARSTIGMSADHDGFDSGKNLAVDYFLPGTPEERFAVGIDIDGVISTASNAAVRGATDMVTTVENLSDGTILKAKITSTFSGKLVITQIITFGVNDKFFKNEVTLENISSDTYDSARYMRSFDPDNTKDQGGEYRTNNTVTKTYGADGQSVVVAETIRDSDKLFTELETRAPIFFSSSDADAKASAFGFSNANPYASGAYDSPATKGETIARDMGITMTWQTQNLKPGEQDSFTYFTSLDDRDYDEVAKDIAKAEDSGLTDIKEDIADPDNTGNKIGDKFVAEDVSGNTIVGNNIVVTEVDNTFGFWEYSTDGGTNFTKMSTSTGVVDLGTSALLLDKDAMVRFVPDENDHGTTKLTFRIWDTATGTNGTTVDPSDNAITFSANSSEAVLTVLAVNDAPGFTVGSNQTINEGDGAQTVSNFIDVSNLTKGPASATDEAEQALTFSTSNNSTSLFADQPKILSDGTLTYTPKTDAAGVVTVTVTLMDNGGTDNGGVDKTSHTFTITITGSNDAPVVNQSLSPTLTSISEDIANGSNTGTLVSNITSGVTDVDTGAIKSLAITSVDNSNGTWQYNPDPSTDATNFIDVGSVSNTAALLLSNTAKLRFVPNADYNGQAYISFRAWDQTSGISGTKVDVSTNGGGTAFSAESDTATITVTPVDDKPVLATSGISSSFETGAGSPVTVDAGFTVTDRADFGTSHDRITSATVKITTNKEAEDILSGTTANGITFSAYNSTTGTISLTSSGHTAAEYQAALRTLQFTSTSTLVSDRTVQYNINGETVDTAVKVVAPDPNVAPTFIVPAAQNVSEDGTLTITSEVSIADGDGADDAFTTTLTVSNGTIAYSGGTPGTSVTISGTKNDVNTALALLTYVPNANYNGSDQIFMSTSDGKDITTSTIDITVAPVNDAPVLNTGLDYAITSTYEDVLDSNNSGMTIGNLLSSGSVTDVDVATAIEKIAISTIDNSNGVWQFSTDNGVTFTNVGAISAASSLILDDTAKIRFKPNAGYNGSATITFRAVDATDATASGSTANTTSNGLTTAFSSDAVTATIIVEAVNDAPSFAFISDQTVDGKAVITTPSNSFERVITVIQDEGKITIPNFLKNFVNGGGADENSQVQTISVSNSLTSLFSSDPVIDGSGNLTFTTTSGTTGNATITVTTNDGGGTSNGGVATYTKTFQIVVTDRNDAPVLASTTNAEMTTLTEDQGLFNDSNVSNLPGMTVGELLPAGTFTDPDSSSSVVSKIAISIVDNTIGTWQYSTDGGTTFVNFTDGTETEKKTTVTFEDKALLLESTDKIRFVPDADQNGVSTLTYHAWDGTEGTSGGTLDTTSTGNKTGGDKSLSVDTNIIKISVTPVNDAPTADSFSAKSGVAGNEISLTGLKVTDIDAALGSSKSTSNYVELTLSTTVGTLNLDLKGLTVVSGSVGSSDLVVKGPIYSLNTALQKLSLGTVGGDGDQTADITYKFSDLGNIGAGNVLITEGSTSVYISGVRAAEPPNHPGTPPPPPAPTPAPPVAGPKLSGPNLVTVVDGDGDNGQGNTEPTRIAAPEPRTNAGTGLGVGIIDQGQGTLTQAGDDRFQVVVIKNDGGNSNTDANLVVNKGITDTVIGGGAFTFSIPPDAFAHTDAKIAVQLSVNQADGSALPAWLRFDAQKGTFIGEAPEGTTDEMEIVVTARDENGLEAIVKFKVTLSDGANAIQSGTQLGNDDPNKASLDVSDLDDVSIPDVANSALDLFAPIDKKSDEHITAGKPAFKDQLASVGQSGLVLKRTALIKAARAAGAREVA